MKDDVHDIVDNASSDGIRGGAQEEKEKRDEKDEEEEEKEGQAEERY